LFFWPPPPQVFGAAHTPQSRASPQPSLAKPHSAPTAGHVLGEHGVSPHRFSPPPPQNWPAGQAPQSTLPPQPSGAEPHWAPSEAHTAGVHGGAAASPAASGLAVSGPEAFASAYGR
jgi:hypothetical protein